MPTSPEDGLRVDGLRVAYQRDAEIVRGVSLTVDPGTIAGVIGPNGAGKSTLLRGIAGLATVTGGRVTLDGTDLTSRPPRRLLESGLAFVPQEHTTFPEMTVEENLRLGGWIRRRQRPWLNGRIERVCEIFPALGSRLDQPAGSLSGGQQKMVEVGRCLISEPRVLLLDEPTAGLSPGMARQVYEQIRRLRDETRVSVLLVDQNVREALQLADHVYALAMGRNDTDGGAADVAGRLDDVVRGWMRRSGSGVVG